ncbi:uncharacterized protein RBU33_018651 isoform 3-T5 [Hipposideros larvatus]
MRSCTCSVARTQTAYIGTDRLVAAGPPYLAPEQGPEYGGNSEEHRVVKGPARRGAYQWMRGRRRKRHAHNRTQTLQCGFHIVWSGLVTPRKLGFNTKTVPWRDCHGNSPVRYDIPGTGRYIIDWLQSNQTSGPRTDFWTLEF